MRRPFEWGKSDCAFWADVVLAVTGWDAIWDGRGYDDAVSARKALRNAERVHPRWENDRGYSSVLELVEDRLVEIPVAHAMRGDVVFPKDDLGPLGSPFVLDGAHAFSKSLAGPLTLNRSECVRAFAF